MGEGVQPRNLESYLSEEEVHFLQRQLEEGEKVFDGEMRRGETVGGDGSSVAHN